MKQHDLIQGSPQWKAYRTQHWNASDAPAMMGVSPYKTRAELLRELHTGVVADVDVATQRSYDNGHRVEALARPLAEEFIGVELYPVTGSLDVGLTKPLSASFDGLDLDEQNGFEHKALNNELRACFRSIETIAPAHRERNAGHELPIYHRIQMEQQLHISGARRILFMTSKWAADEQLVQEEHCWYYPDLKLRAEIVAGWAQFERDLAAFVMPEAAAPAPAGKAPETLPALHIEITGKVTASNLAEFKETALAAIRAVNQDLKTDADFADAAKAIKWCEDVETRLEAAKQHALGQTASIDALFKVMDDIRAEARDKRLDLNKLVTRRKTEVKEEAVLGARTELAQHIEALNSELIGARLQPMAVDFAAVIKGLRSFDSMQAALDTALAHAKIAAEKAARDIRGNMAAFKEHAAGFEFLFADVAQLVHKAGEDFLATVRARIAEHKQAEAARIEAERLRLQAEADARQAAERQRQERLDAERRQRINARIEQLQDMLTAGACDSSLQIDAMIMRVQANEPSEDLYGDRMAEAVALRSRVLIALGEQLLAAQKREAEQAAAAEAQRLREAAARVPAPAPAAAPAPAQRADEPATLKLGTICERLGFTVSAAFLEGLGFKASMDKRACLYRESAWPSICRGISAHVLAVAVLEVATA